MSKTKNDNSVLLEALINIFTVEKGKLKILLERKKEEPYKGYWEIPNQKIDSEETIEEATEKILKKHNLKHITVEQEHTFSSINRNPSDRVVAISHVGFVDSKTIEIKNQNINEINWFSINEIPKMAFDHKQIIELSISKLKSKLSNTSILKEIFPNDFTLPELQNIYEIILNKELDRRNFRKKFINLIEETGYNSTGGNGRPAKLYKFKDNIKEINLF